MEFSFGTWVKRRRKSLDLTQQELAKSVGCSVSAIFKIESNERRPSRQIAELLAEHLDIPPDQRIQFLKMARQESAVDQADGLVQPAALHMAAPLPAAPVNSEPAAITHPPPVELPLPVNVLIGREHELRAISQQIEDPACRLLTLTGQGGVGKTRLALEVARRLRELRAVETYFVSLVGTGAPEHIIPAIGDTLGFPFSGQSDLKAQLFQYLKEKRVMLVLDNLEHLLDGIELLDELLEYAPGVKILTTSREPLNLRGEWVFEVHGLPVPSEVDDEPIETNSAAALFLQRSKQANVNFTPSPADLSAITRICQLVEGLPLGLELAASWVRVTSLQEVAQEIERSIDFLTTTARDMPQRHRSIRAVFDHSWGLLSVEERQAMQRLSVFRGGFIREAAEQVTGAALPLLSALVDKSLVRRGADRRYDLHELTRQYAAEQLQTEALEVCDSCARHASYYLTLLGASQQELRSERQKEALDRLKPEIDNIRAAWGFAVANESADLLRQAAGGLYYFYELQQFFQEAETLFRRAAEMLQQRLTAGGMSEADLSRLLGVWVEVQGCQAFFLMRMGRNREALALYRQNLDRLSKLDEPFLTAYNYIFLGIGSWAVGEFDQSERSFRQGLPWSQELDHSWLYGIGMCFLGALEHDLGKLDAAYEHLSEAMAISRKTGDPYITLLTGMMFSRTAQASGKLSQELLLENLRTAREAGNRWAIGLGLEQLAMIALQSGDDAQAHHMLEEGIALHRDVGDIWSLTRALNAFSRLALANQDLAAAEQHAVESIRAAAHEQYYPNALDGLAILASVLAQRGQTLTAMEIARYVLNHPSSPPEAREQAAALCAETEAQFPDQQTAAVQNQSQDWTVERFLNQILPAHSW